MLTRFIGLFVFVAFSGAVIFLSGGGVAFIERPVGTGYLILWVIWWVASILEGRFGVSSAYGEHQWLLTTAGIVDILTLAVASPWEYAHFDGPIPRDGVLAWFGLALFMVGISLQSVAMWSLHGHFTLRLGVEPGHCLVTSGPYRLVRHPGYLSYITSLTGIGLALSSLFALGLVVPVVLFLLWRIRQEEDMLVMELGEKYSTYMKQTRWRLLPWVY